MRIGLLIAGSRWASDAVSVAQAAEQAGVAEIRVSEETISKTAPSWWLLR